MSVVTKFFGGDDGQEFSIVHPFSIGGRTEAEVDQLIINGKAHGGHGGEIKDELTFDADEYINLMAIRSGSRIDSIFFSTNKHRKWGPYGGEGGKEHILSGIRVIGIGGRSGSRLDRLSVRIIEGYKPSRVAQNNLSAIVSIVGPPNTTIEVFESLRVKQLRTSTQLYRFSGETSTSVSAEYLAKVSSELKTSFFNEKQLIEEYEKEAKNSRTTKIVVDKERVALEVSKIQVLEDVNGQYWFFPLLTSSNTIIVPVDQPIQGSILDLTGAIDSQIPSMSSHKEQKYGQDFYALKK